MGGFEDGMPRCVVDVGSGSDSDASYHGGKLVGYIVAVQVQGGYYRIFFRLQQGVLQERVGYAVFDDNLAGVGGIGKGGICRFFSQVFLYLVVLVHGESLVGKLLLCHFISPAFEPAFGKFHDVAFMHQCDGSLMMLQGIPDGGTYQPFAPFGGDRFYAEGRGLGETYFAYSHLVVKEGVELLGFGSSLFPFDACIDVFRVFAENVHVYFLRFFQWGNDSLEPAYRAQAYIKVEGLAQGYVQRTDASAYGSGQRPFDAYQVFAENIKGGLGEPFACLGKCFSSCKHFHPFDGTFASVCGSDRFVHNILAYRSDFGAYSVTFYIRYGYTVGYNQPTVFHLYFAHNGLLF